MLLIKDIEYEEVPGLTACVAHLDNPTPIRLSDARKLTKGTHKLVECIDGEVFWVEGGDRVVIGMTQKVRDVLGLPLEAFSRQNTQIQELQQVCQGYVDTLGRIRRATLGHRLKYLFTGEV